MSGNRTFLISFALILFAILTGFLHSRGYIPGDVAVPIYGAILPLIGVTLRLAIKNLEKKVDAISEEVKNGKVSGGTEEEGRGPES